MDLSRWHRLQAFGPFFSMETAFVGEKIVCVRTTTSRPSLMRGMWQFMQRSPSLPGAWCVCRRRAAGSRYASWHFRHRPSSWSAEWGQTWPMGWCGSWQSIQRRRE
jgi:hypothetical protein